MNVRSVLSSGGDTRCQEVLLNQQLSSNQQISASVSSTWMSPMTQPPEADTLTFSVPSHTSSSQAAQPPNEPSTKTLTLRILTNLRLSEPKSLKR